MALFVATPGAAHPWLTVPTVPESRVPRAVRAILSDIRGILADNAADLGEPVYLSARVVTGPDAGGGPRVALVLAQSGRIARIYPGADLPASAAAALAAARVARSRCIGKVGAA